MAVPTVTARGKCFLMVLTCLMKCVIIVDNLFINELLKDCVLHCYKGCQLFIIFGALEQGALLDTWFVHLSRSLVYQFLIDRCVVGNTHR